MLAAVHRPVSFRGPFAALAHVRAITKTRSLYLRAPFNASSRARNLQHRVRACYPFVRVHTNTVARAESRLSYGFVAGPAPTRPR